MDLLCGAVYVKNESEMNLMAILSQLTPLHWTDPIEVGATARSNAASAGSR